MIKADVLENGEVLIYEKTVSDSVRFETVRFTFPKSWEGLNKTAVFKNGDRAIGIILNSDSLYCLNENECYIPHEVIHPPKFTVSVFGVNHEKRATSARGEIFVTESGFEIGDSPSEPTESEYSQILTSSNEARTLAQSVRDDLDSGNYTGPKGDKGDKGDTGTAGIYYGNEEPNDPNHPVWINPEGCVLDREALNLLVEECVDTKIAQRKKVIAENTHGITAADEITPFFNYSVLLVETAEGGSALCSYKISGNDIYVLGCGIDENSLINDSGDMNILQIWIHLTLDADGNISYLEDKCYVVQYDQATVCYPEQKTLIKLTGIY